MKIKLTLLALCCGVSAAQASDLILTGVIDGPLSGGTPKAVEIFVKNDISDLSVCGIGSANNGNPSSGEEYTFPNVAAVAGSYLYVASESPQFSAFMGFSPDFTHGTALSINGDDVIELFCNDQVIDVFGELEVDGTGTGWEYLDGWAYRKSDTVANGATFTLANWTFSGKNKLDNETSNANAATPFPIATFTTSDNGTGEPTDGEGEPTDGNGETDELLLGACNETATAISAIQGAGDTSPVVGETHVIEALVTSSLPAIDGFFVQELAANEDTDPLTSEGLFVVNSQVDYPAVGNIVRVLGTVSESFGKTQLLASDALFDCGTGSVTARQISLPFASAQLPESLEGMLVSFNDELVVTDNYALGQYGEVTLASKRLFIPTNVHTPGSSEALALATENALNRVILDDGQNGSNPDPVIYPTNGLSAVNTLRVGDKVAGVTGVMDYSFSSYRVIPTQYPQFIHSNLRQATPDITQGNLRIASANVLNLFNGNDVGNRFPAERGARTELEYERQIAKTVNALLTMDADIIGLMEIENDGFAENSTIFDLVSRLNAQAGEGTYAFVDAGGEIGTDAIAVGLLYQPAQVTPVGEVQINLDAIHNRPPLAQRFALTENAEQITVVVNHFKSKGCGSASGADLDIGDGQSCYNGKRVAQAQSLISWLNTNAALAEQDNVLVIGDLNAYAKEEPIVEFTNNGFVNLVAAHQGAEAYSYTYAGESGYLDHALASTILAAKVVDTIEWHINADEPRALDYSMQYTNDIQDFSFYAEDVFRVSDHDPVIISLQLEPAALFGDFDDDGDIDMLDIRAMMTAIQTGQSLDIRYDLNGDSRVSVIDARLLMNQCTRTRCAL
ncbi:ExeM/NucH family extracellular endonuclease [Alteromonadaceae bacterium BrNp21-10]|nr:ExeM/NucH family extracellular endonuclease [Alteromonadaceae bacterium BrNp21-10]